MLKQGIKTREWTKKKKKLIEIYLEKKITRCEISGSKFALSFHHIKKRSSQEAEHTFEGTRLLSQEWHDFCEYNKEANKLLVEKPRGFDKGYFERFKEMKKEKQRSSKTKKADWEKAHKCKKCKRIITMYLCPHCGSISI
jgi:hypothetical protein